MFHAVDRWFLRRRPVDLRDRGMAILTGMMIALFVFVLSLSLFAVVQRDNDFYRRQEIQTRAYLTARAGFEFFKENAESFDLAPSQGPIAVPMLLANGSPDPDPYEYQIFTLTLNKSTGDLQSIGEIHLHSKGGALLGQRTLVAPGLHVSGPTGPDFSRILDLSQ